MAPVEMPHSGSLLLLPSAAFPVTAAGVRGAYQDAVASVLSQVWQSRSPASGSTVLDIIVPCPFLQQFRSTPRSTLFPHVQTLVAGLYKLVALAATRDSIELDNPTGIDARVLLLSYGDERQDDEDDEAVQDRAAGASTAWSFGPIIQSHTLLNSGRTWQTVYVSREDIGLQICARLANANGETPAIHELPQTPPPSTENVERHGPLHVTPAAGEAKHYHIAVGGTFDHLHIGHKLLLTMVAFALDPSRPQSEQESVSQGSLRQQPSCSITVGITGDELLKRKKYVEVLEDWSVRQASVQNFLRAIMDFRPVGSRAIKSQEQNDEGPNGRAVKTWLDDLVIDCVEIWDPFGPTITDENLSALVLSGETRSGGKAVNEKRNERGWPDLAVFEVDVLDAQESDGNEPAENEWKNKISSTEIRKAHLEKLRSEGSN